MLKKIFGFLSFSSVPICIVLLSLFISFDTAHAVYEGDNGENPLNIVIQQSEDIQENKISIDDEKVDEYPDLGSEQVFPFEAGFGKNSGKS